MHLEHHFSRFQLSHIEHLVDQFVHTIDVTFGGIEKFRLLPLRKLFGMIHEIRDQIDVSTQTLCGFRADPWREGPVSDSVRPSMPCYGVTRLGLPIVEELETDLVEYDVLKLLSFEIRRQALLQFGVLRCRVNGAEELSQLSPSLSFFKRKALAVVVVVIVRPHAP